MPDTFVIPGGKVYFDLFDANANPQGERYLGNTQGANMATTPAKLATYSNEDGVAEKADEATTRIDRTINLRVRNLDRDNLALYNLAQAVTKTQGSGSATDDPVNGGNGVKQGHWYQLGVSAADPSGVRGIASLVLTDDVPSPAFTEGAAADYVEDLELARIYVVPGGGIADGTVLLADFSKNANTRDQVIAVSTDTQQGALRVLGANLKGPERDYFYPKVNLTPTGDLVIKNDPESERYQELQFEVEVLKKDGLTAPLYIDGRPV